MQVNPNGGFAPPQQAYAFSRVKLDANGTRLGTIRKQGRYDVLELSNEETIDSAELQNLFKEMNQMTRTMDRVGKVVTLEKGVAGNLC